MSDETHEEEGFWIEISTNYSSDSEADTEPIIHIYTETTMSNDDEVTKHEKLQLSLLDNKIIWKDPEYKIDKDDLRECNKFLKSPYEKDPSITNWEFLCNEWKHRKDIKFPKKQPNYSSIKL